MLCLLPRQYRLLRPKEGLLHGGVGKNGLRLGIFCHGVAGKLRRDFAAVKPAKPIRQREAKPRRAFAHGIAVLVAGPVAYFRMHKVVYFHKGIFLII